MSFSRIVVVLLHSIVLFMIVSGFKQCSDSKDPVDPEDVRLDQPACTDDDPCQINIDEISTYFGNPEFEGHWNYTTPDYPVYGGRIFLYLNLTVNGKSYTAMSNLARAKDEDGNDLSTFSGGFPPNTNIDLELWAFLGQNDIPSGNGQMELKLEVKPYKPEQGEEQHLCVYTDVVVT